MWGIIFYFNVKWQGNTNDNPNKYSSGNVKL